MIFNGLSLLCVLPLAVFIVLAVAVTIYGAPADPAPEYSTLDRLDGLEDDDCPGCPVCHIQDAEAAS